MQPFFTLKGLNQKARRIQAVSGGKLADAKDQATREVTGLDDYGQLFRARLALYHDYQQTIGQAAQGTATDGLPLTGTTTPVIPAIASVSDNGWAPVAFNAGRWLAEAADTELQELADFGCFPEMGLPYRIAGSVQDDSAEMQALFAYQDAADDDLFVQVDILVAFADIDAVRRWIQVNRPLIRLLPDAADSH